MGASDIAKGLEWESLEQPSQLNNANRQNQQLITFLSLIPDDTNIDLNNAA